MFRRKGTVLTLCRCSHQGHIWGCTPGAWHPAGRGSHGSRGAVEEGVGCCGCVLLVLLPLIGVPGVPRAGQHPAPRGEGLRPPGGKRAPIFPVGEQVEPAAPSRGPQPPSPRCQGGAGGAGKHLAPATISRGGFNPSLRTGSSRGHATF